MRTIHVCLFGNTRGIRAAAHVPFDRRIQLRHAGAETGWSIGERSRLTEIEPDIMILDHQSPQTPAILTWMRGHLPETRLISIMTRAFMAGICLSGIIVKEIQGIVHELSILEELPKAVLAVIHGGTWFSPAFLEAKDLHGGKEERANLPFPVPMLSKRQIEIMECVAQGLINKQIADQLRLSEHTVGGHFKEIFKKLGVHNRQEAVSKYLKGYSQRARELI